MRAIGTAVLVLLAAAGGYVVGHHDGQTAELPRITEDSPGWDCHTMGNRICGVTP